MDIFRELLLGNTENVLISPESILSTLSILYNITTGIASNQILKYLEKENDKYIDIDNNHDMEIDTKEVTELTTVNKIYISDYINVNVNFIEKMKYFFEFINFNSEQTTSDINKYIETSTNGKINKLFVNRLSTDTRILIVNVIHFKAKWKYPFLKDCTFKDKFYTPTGSTTIDTMVVKDKSFLHNHIYEQYGSFSIVDIPYTGNSSMLIILPDKIDGLYYIEEHITNENLKKWIGTLSVKRVDIYLPKFNIDAIEPYDLIPILKKIGISEVFNNSSLINISNDHLTINNIFHKSFIEVNEEYTEAAAVTTCQIIKFSLNKKIIFHVNHPFIYLIKDKNNKILFIGRYYFPNK
ncbi:serine protease inhibitor-like protein SPI-1 [Yokapox virus]|uniref:Serine protease inhibitor-like protein SPI-1 n=1 Tax=Yokapox virus TaxID=1076255 RepID=G3EI69_9POXV|nr:serine protease inhibitor-like protein SPI-1 [Yokapox virus]AEN03766.1 serine protease inhibitor-like protein SPI-1 [Yokapox virus]